jgi:hypothetical protein
MPTDLPNRPLPAWIITAVRIAATLRMAHMHAAVAAFRFSNAALARGWKRTGAVLGAEGRWLRRQ